MKRINRQRLTRLTLLAVGEGYAEVALLEHIRNLYTANNNGCHMAIKNARGKGAKHVVDYALKCAAQSAYDKKIALLDTDTTCWTQALQARARRQNLIIIPSTPCLEAE